MSVVSKIGSRGQVTLPKDIRKRFGFEAGQSVAFVIKKGELTLVPLKHTLFDFEGALGDTEVADLEQVRISVRTVQARRIAKGD